MKQKSKLVKNTKKKTVTNRSPYRIGSRVTVSRPRSASFQGTIAKVNAKTIVLTDLTGSMSKHRRGIRISIKAIKDGRIWLGKKPSGKKPQKKTQKSVSIFVQTRRGYTAKNFPIGVIPKGFRLPRNSDEIETAEWRHFTFNGKRILGRFYRD